jgi:very-short-patch-repair endonuclease
MNTHQSLDLKFALRLDRQARQNRSGLTPPEALLWSALKGRQLGVQFRSQVPLAGCFIVDFLASSAGLVVEVDGEYHAQRQRSNQRRDDELERLGYRVVRIEAELVFRDLPAAVALIRAAL